MSYFAHSGTSAAFRDWQPLAEHLKNVAELARQAAAQVRPGNTELAEAAMLAVLLQDLGKYRTGFQSYIRAVATPREDWLHKQAGRPIPAASGSSKTTDLHPILVRQTQPQPMTATKFREEPLLYSFM